MLRASPGRADRIVISSIASIVPGFARPGEWIAERREAPFAAASAPWHSPAAVTILCVHDENPVGCSRRAGPGRGARDAVAGRGGAREKACAAPAARGCRAESAERGGAAARH